MALVIGLDITKKEESSFFVNDIEVKLLDITHKLRFKVEVDGPMKKVYTITDRVKTNILPNVAVSAGSSKRKAGVVVLVIDAPRAIRILRKKLYDKGN